MRVSVPATIANFGPGFDVFGLCLEKPRDFIRVELSDEIEVKVKGYKVPEEPDKNVASVSALSLLRQAGVESGFKMKLEKGIRPKSGLGSSGASALGGALAVARLLDIENREIILRAALEGERAASGSPHGDNVVPALFGGFVVLKSLFPLEVFKIDAKLKLVVVLPEVEVSTKRAREVLPKYVPLSDAVRNLALASSLVLALENGDIEEVGKLLDDYLAIPYRKPIIPWFDKVRKAALESGAYGLSISGSGPAVFALGEDLDGIGKAIVEAFEEEETKAEYFITKVGGGAE